MPARRCGACGAGGHRTGCGARPGGRADDHGGPCGPGPRDLAGRTAGPAWPWPVLPWSWRAWPGLAAPGLALAGPGRARRSACRVLVGLAVGLSGPAGPGRALAAPGGPGRGCRALTGTAWPFAGADRVGMALAVLAGPFGSLPGRSGPCRASSRPGLVAWWAGPGLADQGPVDLAGSRWLGAVDLRRVPVAGASGLPAGASDPSVGMSCVARPSGPWPLPGGRASPGPGAVARTGRDP